MSILLPSHSQNELMDTVSQSTDGGVSTSYQTLLLEAYSAIGEPDSVYGAGAGRLADTESRIRTYEHENIWFKALGNTQPFVKCSGLSCAKAASTNTWLRYSMFLLHP